MIKLKKHKMLPVSLYSHSSFFFCQENLKRMHKQELSPNAMYCMNMAQCKFYNLKANLIFAFTSWCFTSWKYFLSCHWKYYLVKWLSYELYHFSIIVIAMLMQECIHLWIFCMITSVFWNTDMKKSCIIKTWHVIRNFIWESI